MQKKIIALAVAGLMSGAAFAQSNVTISGLVRMSYEQYKVNGVPAGFNANAEHRVSDQSSMLVFTGKEDLGGGMYAGFVFDNRWAPDLGAGSISGNSNINIGGNWGRVAMGRQDLHYGTAIESYKAYTLQNILSNGLFSQVNGVVIANATRTPNVIMYDSPNMSGFSGRLAFSTNWAGNEGSGVATAAQVAAGNSNPGKGKATNLALNYANGPIKAGYSYWDAKAEGVPGTAAASVATVGTAASGTGVNQRGDTLQFGYTFPMGLAIGIGWNKSRAQASDFEARRTAWVIPASYTFGANQIALTYAKAGDLSGSFCAAGCGDTGAKAFTLAYGYSLSKRTNVGVSYTKLSNETNGSYNLFAMGASGGQQVTAGAGSLAGSDPSQFSVNVNHSF